MSLKEGKEWKADTDEPGWDTLLLFCLLSVLSLVWKIPVILLNNPLKQTSSSFSSFQWQLLYLFSQFQYFFNLQEGNDMINSGHEASPEIKDILGNLNSQWRDLADRSEDKGRKLRQASQQHTLNRALSDAQVCVPGYFVCNIHPVDLQSPFYINTF